MCSRVYPRIRCGLRNTYHSRKEIVLRRWRGVLVPLGLNSRHIVASQEYVGRVLQVVYGALAANVFRGLKFVERKEERREVVIDKRCALTVGTLQRVLV